MGFAVKKKIWLEFDNKPIMGVGRYNLLKSIDKTHSLKLSAKIVGISEKTAHNYIIRIEARIGKRIIETSKGGKDAGGSTRLTDIGKSLIKRYEVAR